MTEAATTIETGATETQAATTAAEEKSPAKAAPGEGRTETSPAKAEDEYISEEEWNALAKKKIRIPVGKEQVAIDLASLRKNEAINASTTRKAQEVAEYERKVKEIEAAAAAREDRLGKFLLAAKEDPSVLWQLAQQLGHDPEQLAIARAREAYEWKNMSQEQRDAVIAKRERDAYKQQLEEIESQKVLSEQDAQKQALTEEIQDDVIACVKATGLDFDVINTERVAQAIQFLYNKTDKKPAPTEVASFVLATLQQDMKNYISKMSPEEAVKILPKEFLNALQKQLIKSAEKDLPYAPSKRSSASAESKTTAKPKTVNEWFKSL